MHYTIRTKKGLLNLSTPIVMGIINTTPDSFFAPSRTTLLPEIVAKAGAMLSEGAAILDIGGYSTRPGAEEVSEAEELDRVIPAVEAIADQFPEAIISVDTFRSTIARAAIEAGASLINDASFGNGDAAMFKTVAELKVPYILMHTRGNPQTMTQLNQYNDLVTDVVKELQARLSELRRLGVTDVIVDPGFGFAKNIAQNFALLNQLEVFHTLDCPILVGISNKSLIYKTLGISPEEATNGTTFLNAIALQKGAHILRVHQVKPAAECIALHKALLQKTDNLLTLLKN